MDPDVRTNLESLKPQQLQVIIFSRICEGPIQPLYHEREGIQSCIEVATILNQTRGRVIFVLGANLAVAGVSAPQTRVQITSASVRFQLFDGSKLGNLIKNRFFRSV